MPPRPIWRYSGAPVGCVSYPKLGTNRPFPRILLVRSAPVSRRLRGGSAARRDRNRAAVSATVDSDRPVWAMRIAARSRGWPRARSRGGVRCRLTHPDRCCGPPSRGCGLTAGCGFANRLLILLGERLRGVAPWPSPRAPARRRIYHAGEPVRIEAGEHDADAAAAHPARRALLEAAADAALPLDAAAGARGRAARRHLGDRPGAARGPAHAHDAVARPGRTPSNDGSIADAPSRSCPRVSSATIACRGESDDDAAQTASAKRAAIAHGAFLGPPDLGRVGPHRWV